jgi:metacaspase-1
VASFQLPDPAGNAGGACTSALLNVLYKDHHKTSEDLTYVQVLHEMRTMLKDKGYKQIPQLTATNPIDVNVKFDLVPPTATGTRRALLIGIK